MPRLLLALIAAGVAVLIAAFILAAFWLPPPAAPKFPSHAKILSVFFVGATL
jgi:hypothetical protein